VEKDVSLKTTKYGLNIVRINAVNGIASGFRINTRNKWLSDLCEKAGVKPFAIHGIRHLFASILAHDNRPLPEIQAMLRHKNLTTTQRYIKQLKKKSREVLEALSNFEALESKSTSPSTSKAKRALSNIS